MKKIMSMFVLMIFVLSVMPLAIAQVDADDTDEGESRVRDGEVDRTRNVDTREKVRMKNAEERIGAEKARMKLENKVEDLKERGTETARNVRQAELRLKSNVDELRMKARERFDVVKNKHREAKEKFEEHRGNLVELRKKVRGCDGEDCKTRKHELRKGVGQHLIKTTELIARSLEKLQDRVQDSEKLTDDEKSAALAEIATLETAVMAEKDRVAALGENATNEELREAIKSLKKTWQDVRKVQRRLVANLTHAKLGLLVEKHDGLLTSMQARIDNLEKRGVDASSLVDIQIKFEEHLGVVNGAYDEAKQAWQNTGDKKEALEEWRAAQDEVRQQMKESREILREFTREFVKLKKQAGDDSEDADKSEDETDDSDDDSEEQSTTG